MTGKKKTIAVVGATGAQGGGLMRAILEDPQRQFHGRALTRSAQSEKARELAGLGADVIAADLDDPDSLKQAFAGAYGAYCVTNFWEHMSPEREFVITSYSIHYTKLYDGCAVFRGQLLGTLELTLTIL